MPTDAVSWKLLLSNGLQTAEQTNTNHVWTDHLHFLRAFQESRMHVWPLQRWVTLYCAKETEAPGLVFSLRLKACAVPAGKQTCGTLATTSKVFVVTIQIEPSSTYHLSSGKKKLKKGKQKQKQNKTKPMKKKQINCWTLPFRVSNFLP